MIRLINILKEIRTTSTKIRFIATGPREGTVKIDGNLFSWEMRGRNDKILEIMVSQDWDLLEKFAGENWNMDDEDYYPEEESEKACEFIMKYLVGWGAVIVKDGYNVSDIGIPIENIKPYIQYDLPIHLGNGVFEWKNKKIKIVRNPKGDRNADRGGYNYLVFKNNKQIDSISSPNGDAENYYGFISGSSYGLNTIIKYFND